MSAWFRGHSGFGLAFLAITALVAGGLGWVTWVALDLERAQRLAQAQADRYERLRLALWRLDAKLFPVLARESSRPFTHYRPLATFSAAIVPPTRTTAITTCDVLHPSPLIEEPLPSWLQLHFQVNPDQVPVLWESPQVPSDGDWACMMQAKFPVTPVPGSEQRRQVLAELKQKLEPNLVRQWLTQQRQQLEAEARPEVRTEMAAADAMGGPAMDNTPWRGQTDNQATRGDASIKSQRIENEFINRAQQRQQLDRGNVYQGQVQGPAPSVPSTVSAQVGPLRPWWLSLVGREDQLLLARWVKVHETEYCQGLLIDDASLRAELADAVADLFPRALLVRLPAGKNDRPEQTLASLPLVLDPNEPLELPEAEACVWPGWLPSLD
ncbi:MAG TPA: hypothetical protein PKD86_05990 [Gemmatales bacterium]|nr:hypothetical protein [Gemmatales bacterium]